ncbi:glutaredoxin domain-containing protein [Symbioplanes lichenis]|uniref:glutaredoxin domain-containing protein n=1 Tax=Symbioplanes lichenis TaxID=1629072 RepID=UPI002739A3C4|nr:glutaredoxin domain-containing protein [Actinoplanes lichenis]
MLRRWVQAAALLVAGIVLFFVSGPVALIVFVLLAVVASPLVFPRSLSAAEAKRRQARDGRPIIYWRPGCPFCLRLRATLGVRSRRAHWVDIWQDPEGAADVRAVANGNETVPTAITATGAFVNPNPRHLRTTIGI